MKINKHSLLLIIALTIIVLFVVGLTITILYNTAFEQQRAQLIAMTKSQAKLIESVARFDAKFSEHDHTEGAAAATVSQIRGAHLNISGFGKTGEFLLGKREKNNIVFLLPKRFKGVFEKTDQSRPLEVGGLYAEPIQLALAGKSGTTIARDYRGERVLAAYEPVGILNFGVVTKIDLKEIRSPFIRVGLISVTVAIILIMLGAYFFLRVVTPIIKGLQESEAYNRMLFESSPIGIALCRMDGSLVDINQAYANIIGRSIEETKQLSYFDITPEDYADEEQRQLEVLENNEHYGPYEKEYLHKDGHRVPVNLLGQLVERDGEKYIWSIVENINEREKAKKELERIFELSFDLVGMGNLQGYFTKINSSFNRILGYEDEVFLATPFIEFVHEDDVEKTLEALTEATEGKQDFRIVNRYRCKNGDFKWLEWEVLAVVDENVFFASGRDITERQNTEQALELNTSRLNEAQRLAKVGSWELDLLNNELNWSDEIFRMFDIDKSKFGASYDAFLNAIHPEDRDMVHQAYSDSLLNQKPYEIVHRLQMRDGTIKYVRENCETFFDDDKPLRSVGTVQDISQLYKTEQDLKTAMALNEHVIDASPIGIAIYDETGQCIAANNSIANIVGATHEQVLMQNYHKIKSWKESGVYEYATTSIENGERLRGEFDIHTTFGKHAIYDCMFVPFQQYGNQHLLLMLDDITERKATELALREGDLRLNYLASNSPVSIYICDAQPPYAATYITSNIKQLMGFEPEQFTDDAGFWANNIYPDDQERIFSGLEQLFIHDKHIHEYRFRMSDGSFRWISDSLRLTRDENGAAKEIIGFWVDISERKKIEGELIKYRENLEELVEARTKELRDTQDELVRKERLATLGQLTATVSHELRNPLGAMRPSLYIIEKKCNKNDEQVQNAIERIDRNIGRCDRTIDELLDFTRITELNSELTRVNEWLDSVVNEQTLPRGISLEKEFLSKDVELRIDRGRLRRAIINVFENACHAMMDGNEKVVNIKNAILNIKTEVNNERVEIVITDNGSGISDTVLAKIYEPLFSTKGFGVGLGMPTVKQIMQQHSGGIEIKTEKGKGTSVVLWLPINQV